MIRILPKTKSNYENTSVAVCYVNLFFSEIYSATYFYQIKCKLIFFFNHICVLGTNIIQWILLATVQFDIFQDMVLILLKQLCFQLSLFKSSVILKGFVLVIRLTSRQVKPPIFNHLSTLKQIFYFHKCLNSASSSFCPSAACRH